MEALIATRFLSHTRYPDSGSIAQSELGATGKERECAEMRKMRKPLLEGEMIRVGGTSLQKKLNSAGTLFIVHWDPFRTSDRQNCEI